MFGGPCNARLVVGLREALVEEVLQMNIAEIQRRLAEIHDKRHDDGTAHHLEKVLWYIVLKAIAEDNYAVTSGAWAREALKSTDIVFERWFA